MNSTFDDPRLTAYVLDELDKEGRNFIENEMQRRKECLFEARELADFTDQLRAALATEPMPELSPGHKRVIATRLQQCSPSPSTVGSSPIVWRVFIPASSLRRCRQILRVFLAPG